jgi:phasin family protein
LDKNKPTVPAAKAPAKAAPKARATKPVAAKTLPGLPSEPVPSPKPPVVEAAKPAVPTPPLTPPAAQTEPVVAEALAKTAVEAKFAPVAKSPVAKTPAPKAEASEPKDAKPEIKAEVKAPAPRPVAEKAKAPEVSSPTAAVSADSKPKDKIMDATSTIENATKDTAAKTQAMFGEAQTRTQAGLEKSAKLFEDMIAFNKENLEAVVESSKIAAKGAETLGQSAADYAKRSFESASQTLQTLSSVKSPTEFMKLQSDFARTSFDSMVAETSRSTEHMMKLAGEIAQPISNRFAVAAEKMKTVA